MIGVQYGINYNVVLLIFEGLGTGLDVDSYGTTLIIDNNFRVVIM